MQHALIPFVIIGALASWLDLRTGRIPNVLTFGAALAGLVFHLLSGGLAATGWALGGWAIGCALFLPLFMLGGMGAGDVKLLAALGAWVGPRDVLWIAFFAALAGGVMAVAVALLHGYLRRALSNVWMLLCYWRVSGLRPLDQLTVDGSAGPRLAYAVPIAAGSLFAVWWLR